jgi:micrococcal nuclease
MGIADPASAIGCEPSYPDVCIPPSPPDLDCGDVANRRFTVYPPDPHRFDGDFDGVGCEA